MRLSSITSTCYPCRRSMVPLWIHPLLSNMFSRSRSSSALFPDVLSQSSRIRTPEVHLLHHSRDPWVGRRIPLTSSCSGIGSAAEPEGVVDIYSEAAGYTRIATVTLPTALGQPAIGGALGPRGPIFALTGGAPYAPRHATSLSAELLTPIDPCSTAAAYTC